MSVAPLQALPQASLRALAEALRARPLSQGLTQHQLQMIAGPNTAGVMGYLSILAGHSLTSPQMAVVIDAIADTRESFAPFSDLVDLVLSGPDAPGVPTRDTAAVFHTLISKAEREVILAGYAVHNGRTLFAPLAQRMTIVPALKVDFYLNIEREWGDTTDAAQIVQNFALEFRRRHWPWERLPALYYDRRSLATQADERASLHAKCVIVDRAVSLITSANFTEAAHHRNIEAGVVLRHAATAQRLASYFDSLRSQNVLVECPWP
jgi:phosphatidylserine/phosphatidylglycerophosphate/cardiolipin synthase-like enzyme